MVELRIIHPKIIIKRAVFGFAALLILIGFPDPVLISNVSAAETTEKCNPVQPAGSGTTKPTGASAKTYTYDKCTGLYENAHYTYNPATRQYAAKDKPVMSATNRPGPGKILTTGFMFPVRVDMSSVP